MHKNTFGFGLCFLLCVSSSSLFAANDYLKISGFLTTAATYGDNETFTKYRHSIDTDDFAFEEVIVVEMLEAEEEDVD